MDGPGALLHHTPDVVVLGLDAPGVWTMIEVKTLDVTASTHIQSHHTDRERLVQEVLKMEACSVSQAHRA